jgi:hypothetical protein
MRVQLEQKWIDLLTRLPESGMGYQRVDVRFADNRVARDVRVFNAEQAELPEDMARVPIKEIELRQR